MGAGPMILIALGVVLLIAFGIAVVVAVVAFGQRRDDER